MIFPVNGGRGSPSKGKAKSRRKPVKIQWDGAQSVAANAAEALPKLARHFFDAGQGLLSPDPPLESLHRFRLEAKRLRYVLELFRSCYGPGLERRIEKLQTLQQRLGEISDCSSTEALVSARTDLPRRERERLMLHLRKLAARRVFDFQREWRAEFSGPKPERWWIDYLARYAVAPRR